MHNPVTETPATPVRWIEDLPRWVGVWLLLGMWWLLVGMAASPVGDKVWNPGKPYHDSLNVLYLLPALWWCWRRRQAFWQRIKQYWDARLLLVLLCWSALSSLWANYGHGGDNVVTVLYVLLFALTWSALVADYPRLFQRLMFWAGVGLALTALVAMLTFSQRALHTNIWQSEGRLVSFGSLDNPNLAAFAYGATIVWLAQTHVRGRWMHALQMISLVALVAFVVLTYSRATWLGIVAAQVVMAITSRQRHVRVRAAVIIVAAVLALAFGGLHYVEERGMSFRPQIFAQAWQFIVAHPLQGLGMGSRYVIHIGNQTWAHSHNVFTHTAVMLGLPAALVWITLWLITGWRGWRFRHVAAGRCLLALWVFASVAFQFDAPELMQRPSVEWILGWLPLAIGMGLAWRVTRQHELDVAE